MKIENLCTNCMRERRNPDGVCEFCGFDVRTFELPRHHMRPFTILAGKYLIGNAIGEGGFGITYLGMDLNLEVRVAIKEYYPQGFAVRDSRINDSTVWSYSESTQTFFEEGREKFINEAKTIAKFRELPEIVGVTDFFRENQTAYIVMEYLDGQTLKQYLKANGGKIPAENVVRMMRPLIASLGKLHSQNLIHRDISPDNIMLMKNGSIKILDFGGAREFASQDGRSMSVLVKHGYAPEEQYRSRGDQGPWTDVYALCATMYRCITGEIPPNALDRLYQDELKPISSFGENCPKYIEKAITKGLNVRKDGRYQSMEELYESLYKEQKKPEKVPKPEKKDQQEKKNKEEEQDSKQPDKKKKIVVAVAAVAVAAGVVVAAGVGMKMKQSGEKEVVAKVAATPTSIPEATATSEATATPVPEESEPVPTAELTHPSYYYAKEKTKVYVDTDTNSECLGELEDGQEVPYYDDSMNDWLCIKYKNRQKAYVQKAYVSTEIPEERFRLSIADAYASGFYKAGQKIRIEYDGNTQDGYYFHNWSCHIDGVVEDPYATVTEVTMPDEDIDIGWCGSDWKPVEIQTDSLREVLTDYTIKINGESYKLPMTYEEFEQKGWRAEYENLEEEVRIMGVRSTKTFQNQNDSSEINCDLALKADGNVYIVGLGIFKNQNTTLNIEFPGGIVFGKSTRDDIKSAYGETSEDVFSGGDPNYMGYWRDGSVGIDFGFTDEGQMETFNLDNNPSSY